MQNTNRVSNIDVRFPVEVLASVWQQVKGEVIKNCFRKAGFRQNDGSSDEESSVPDDETSDPSVWPQVREAFGADSFSDFVTFDNGVVDNEELTDEEVRATIEGHSELSSDDSEHEDEFPAVRLTSQQQSLMALLRWEEILSVLHLNDPALEKKSTDDGFDHLQNVRPMIEKLNVTFSILAQPEACQAVDKQIIPFKGRRALKVYMAKKPKKWGYKVWVRAGQSGYVHEIEFHRDNLKSDPPDAPVTIGASGRVVLRLATNVPSELLSHLKDKGLHATCTMQKNRTAKCPLMSEKELKKQSGGS
ncbi:hypothetical protein HPB50_004641 [Hyalomma asiaticum]|uniref:Uncharacterized protein n=1 Tax=Hyalomma asiaticum TaxID=266040 RepID=A0ACB7SEH9_HYAAI|nr:hypothetical protein HPB50_004641 [Hyalomma asiaticum]